jgi:hypothetical protein
MKVHSKRSTQMSDDTTASGPGALGAEPASSRVRGAGLYVPRWVALVVVAVVVFVAGFGLARIVDVGGEHHGSERSGQESNGNADMEHAQPEMGR